MTRLCSVDYNEADLLVLQNGCLGIGLGDCDINLGWLEVVYLVAPDITLGEYLEFHYTEDTRHWPCKKIRSCGRFMGYIAPQDLNHMKTLETVMAPVEFEPARGGLRSTNFQEQLAWLIDQNISGWSFYPVQGRTDGMIQLVWGFIKPQDAMLFKLTWA